MTLIDSLSVLVSQKLSWIYYRLWPGAHSYIWFLPEEKKKEQTQVCRSQALSPSPNKSKTPPLRRATSVTLNPRFSVFNPPVEPGMEHKTVLVGVFKEQIGHLLSFHASSVQYTCIHKSSKLIIVLVYLYTDTEYIHYSDIFQHSHFKKNQNKLPVPAASPFFIRLMNYPKLLLILKQQSWISSYKKRHLTNHEEWCQKKKAKETLIPWLHSSLI